MFVRLKKNGKDSKEISLIGQGFQAYIDHLFWFLPFSSPKQAFDLLAKKATRAQSQMKMLRRIPDDPIASDWSNTA